MALVGPFGLQLIQMVRSIQDSLRDLEAALNRTNWPGQPHPGTELLMADR